MKNALPIFAFFLIAACSGSSKKADISAGCESYLKISGQYAIDIREGTVTVAGLETGTVDFSGVDYNDVTCTYRIEDCRNGQAEMRCNGSLVKTNILLLSDEVLLIDGEKFQRILSN